MKFGDYRSYWNDDIRPYISLIFKETQKVLEKIRNEGMLDILMKMRKIGKYGNV